MYGSGTVMERARMEEDPRAEVDLGGDPGGRGTLWKKTRRRDRFHVASPPRLLSNDNEQDVI